MALAADLKDVLETEIASLNLEDHRYFSGLINGKISREAFLESQIQFAYLVRFFSRPMASMVANIPDDIKRMAIVDNLWEEHGKGNPDKIHGKTIVTLIDRLGGDINVLNNSNNVSPSIEIFNIALKGIANFEDYRISASVFGGIERTFVNVSSLICQAIIERGWLPAEQITHYALHKELDIQHAEDFLLVVQDDWVNDKSTRPMIRRGIRLGAALFTRVYSDFADHIAASAARKNA
jgi:pyrroloquinoline-quinone synthase